MTRTGILRTTNKFLTGATAVGDAYPGVPVLGYTGQVPQFLGQLGAIDEMNYAEATRRSDPASTQLQGGRYQYVQFAADGTNYVVGQLLYWKDETNYIVTNVAPIATSARFAGFCLGPVTQGNYWFVQVDGVAWALAQASPGDTSHTDVAVYAVVNTATVNTLADATADATAGVAKLFIGTSKDLAASNAVFRIYIKVMSEVF